jgi:hypothetical protein
MQLDSVPGSERWATVVEKQVRGSRPLPLGKQPVIGIGRSHLYFGSGDRFAIQATTHDGRRTAQLKRSERPAAVTAADVRAFTEREVANSGERNRARIEASLAAIEFPATLPAYTHLVIDVQDLVWVHGFPPGGAWLAHQAGVSADDRAVVAVLNLGSGSGVYGRPFADPAAFDTLIARIAAEVGGVRGRTVRVGRITLTGFSAGYGAIRAILREPRHFTAISGVLLLDGIHTSYVPENTPVASGGAVDTANLAVFAEFARAAVRGEKQFVISHSEIFPGTFASTTESTTWLLRTLGVSRKPVLRWGPRGMQQLSEARSGGFEVLGYAGNSAPDHIDHLHAMPELLAKALARQRSRR